MQQLNLISQLTQFDQFVNYTIVNKNGKSTKPPVNDKGHRINAQDPENWKSYEDAVQTSSNVGFVLTDDDPFLFIDLDHVLKDGKLCDWASELVAALPTTYTEISPSGDGLHLYYKLGNRPIIPGNKRAFDNGTALEVYFSKRYFTITGNVYADHPINEVDTGDLIAILSKYMSWDDEAQQGSSDPSQTPLKHSPMLPQKGVGLSDQQVLEKAFKARNGSAIKTLFDGDISAYNGDRSAADQAFINHLAFYTQDSNLLNQLFKSSKLFRPKWDEVHSQSGDTYGEMTIKNAIAGLRSQYSGKRPNHSVSGLSNDPIFEKMNREFAVACVGNSVRILKVDDSGDFTLIHESQFALLLKNKPKIQVGDSLVPLNQYWLTHPDRREFKGLVFNPKCDPEGYYNQYSGFAVKPVSGGIYFFLDFIREIICSGNAEYYEYLVSWMAQLVQSPEIKAGVAVILRGNKGVGKGKFTQQFGSLFGRHSLVVANGEHLVGKFNSHLSDKLLVIVDESYWNGDKKAEGILKNLVTEPAIMVERKGIDSVSMNSYHRIILTTNNDYAVPASADERRWFVLDVSNSRKDDYEFFKNIDLVMDSGGREALLHYLLNYKIPDHIEVRKAPATTGLEDQKLHSLPPLGQWWMDCLFDGRLYGVDGDFDFDTQGIEVRTSICQKSCNCYIDQHRLGQGVNGAVLGKYLSKVIPGLRKKGRSERRYVFPNLNQMRKDFESEIGKYDWNW